MNKTADAIIFISIETNDQQRHAVRYQSITIEYMEFANIFLLAIRFANLFLFCISLYSLCHFRLDQIGLILFCRKQPLPLWFSIISDYSLPRSRFHNYAKVFVNIAICNNRVFDDRNHTVYHTMQYLNSNMYYCCKVSLHCIYVTFWASLSLVIE